MRRNLHVELVADNGKPHGMDGVQKLTVFDGVQAMSAGNSDVQRPYQQGQCRNSGADDMRPVGRLPM